MSADPNGREEFRRKRRHRNWAIAGVLVAVIVLLYVVSLVRLGGA